jgi:hypothetical protein
MVQILEQLDVGEQIGRGLGGGLSGGLQQLVASKIAAKQQQQKLATIRSLLGGADLPGEDTEVDFLDKSVQRPSGEVTNEQILAVSQLDPNLAKILQSQQKAGIQDKASRFKETKEVRKDLLNQSKAAKENDLRLDRMNELNEQGKLIPGLYNDLMKKFGVDFSALKNPDSQEFEKLSVDMLKNAREIFGARVTNFEVQNFLKSIPNLSQSKEGRSRVIRNFKLLNEGARARSDALRDVLKENRGVPPYDLGEQVEEKIGPKLDQISEKFVAGAQIESPSSQSFESLPKAAEFSGKIVRDTETGKRYRSNGKSWKEVK